MYVNSLWMDRYKELFDYNDETGKYFKKIGNWTIEINSWNNKVIIYTYLFTYLQMLPDEVVKFIIEMNLINPILFKKESDK